MSTKQAIVTSEEIKQLLDIIPNVEQNKGDTMSSVTNYISGKVMVKEGREVIKLNKAPFFEDVATKIIALKADASLTSKARYKKALSVVKQSYDLRGVSVNSEFGLMSFWLDKGLSLDKIINNIDNLSKWRLQLKHEDITFKDILKLCK